MSAADQVRLPAEPYNADDLDWIVAEFKSRLHDLEQARVNSTADARGAMRRNLEEWKADHFPRLLVSALASRRETAGRDAPSDPSDCPKCGKATFVTRMGRYCENPDCTFVGSRADVPEPEEPFWHDGNLPDPDAENDSALRDLETICAFCGMPHHKDSYQRDCPCSRHIDHSGTTACNAAAPSEAGSELPKADIKGPTVTGETWQQIARVVSESAPGVVSDEDVERAWRCYNGIAEFFGCGDHDASDKDRLHRALADFASRMTPRRLAHDVKDGGE